LWGRVAGKTTRSKNQLKKRGARGVSLKTMKGKSCWLDDSTESFLGGKKTWGAVKKLGRITLRRQQGFRGGVRGKKDLVLT